MKPQRSVLVVTMLSAAIGISACSGSGSTGTSTGSTKTPLISSSPGSASTPATTAGSSSGKVQASGDCSSIDKHTAESILGSPTAAGLSTKTTGLSVGGMKKIDGCSYLSATNGSLAYTVLRGDATFGHTIIGATRSRLTKQSKMPGSPVTVFEAGLPDSVSFTQRLGGGVDSQITVLAGDSLITVAVARKDGNVTKAQSSAKAAAQRLVSAA